MENSDEFELEQGVAAFFDLDGTLLALPSLELRFFRLLRRRGLLGARSCFAWLCEAARLLPRGFQQIVHANKAYLRGVPTHPMCLEVPALPFYRGGIERVKWHVARGHLLVIVSGTLDPLARLATAELRRRIQNVGPGSSIRVCATHLEEKNARWTGRILGEAMFGEAKARAIRRIAAEAGLDLERCFAYGDSIHDRSLLEAVGRPAAVNPSLDLARIAHRNGWPVLRWSDLYGSTRPASLSSKSEDVSSVTSRPVRTATTAQVDATHAETGLNV